jgi:hypothetical protein
MACHFVQYFVEYSGFSNWYKTLVIVLKEASLHSLDQLNSKIHLFIGLQVFVILKVTGHR